MGPQTKLIWDVNRGLGDRIVSTSRCLSAFGYDAMSQKLNEPSFKDHPLALSSLSKRDVGAPVANTLVESSILGLVKLSGASSIMVKECARNLSAMPAQHDCSSSARDELDKYCRQSRKTRTR